MVYLDEESDDESVGDLAPIPDEEPIAQTMKRKRTVSTSRIPLSTPDSRAEIIILQDCNSGTESKQKAEGNLVDNVPGIMILLQPPLNDAAPHWRDGSNTTH